MSSATNSLDTTGTGASSASNPPWTASADEGVMVCNFSGTIQQANSRAALLLDTQHVHLPGANLAEFLLPIDNRGIRPWWREVPPAFVAVKSSSSRLVVSVRALHGRNARDTLFLLIFSPAEVGISQLVLPWENSAELALVFSIEGKVLAVNRSFARKFGRQFDTWPGVPVSTLVHPEESEGWKRTTSDVTCAPYRTTVEQRWQTAQGWRVLQWEKTLVRDSQGNPIAIRAIGHDISKRKLAEEQYLKLASAVEQSPISIVIAGTDGKVQYVNPKFTEVCGYTLEDLLDQSADVLKAGHPDEAAYRAFQETLQSGAEWRGVLQATRKDGSPLWESVRALGLKNHRGELSHILCLREDITERKHLEEQLRQAQKMDSLGTLAGGIAHDFNNMLAIVSGYTQMCLAHHSEGNATLKKCLREVQIATQRASGLVRQILTFSRKTEVNFSPVSVNNLIRELTQLLAETFPRTITFEFELDPKLPDFLADQNQLQQVLMNLCVNARDAMPQGGRICISTRVVERRHVNIGMVQSASHFVRLTVADSGMGMSAAVKNRIFEPFFTTKQSNGGTGLGLAVVYGIILNHNGVIDVESTPGMGSSFIVHLPIIATGAAVFVDKITDGGIPRGEESVLVVEDESSLRALLSTALQQAGYTVTTAADGMEAIDFLLRDTRPLDAVFLDLNLPGFDGVEVFKKIRERRPHLPVLIVSGNITPEARDELTRLGQLNFIQKPYRLEDIGKALRSLFVPAV